MQACAEKLRRDNGLDIARQNWSSGITVHVEEEVLNHAEPSEHDGAEVGTEEVLVAQDESLRLDVVLGRLRCTVRPRLGGRLDGAVPRNRQNGSDHQQPESQDDRADHQLDQTEGCPMECRSVMTHQSLALFLLIRPDPSMLNEIPSRAR